MRGVITHSFSLDHVGPMTWNVEDCASCSAPSPGTIPDDPTSDDEPVPDYTADLSRGIKGLRIGVLRHLYETDMTVDPDTIAAMDAAYRSSPTSAPSSRRSASDPCRNIPNAAPSSSRRRIMRFTRHDFIERLNDYGALIRNRNTGPP